MTYRAVERDSPLEFRNEGKAEPDRPALFFSNNNEIQYRR